MDPDSSSAGNKSPKQLKSQTFSDAFQPKSSRIQSLQMWLLMHISSYSLEAGYQCWHPFAAILSAHHSEFIVARMYSNYSLYHLWLIKILVIGGFSTVFMQIFFLARLIFLRPFVACGLSLTNIFFLNLNRNSLMVWEIYFFIPSLFSCWGFNEKIDTTHTVL